MDHIRKWLNKPKKEVETQLIQPLNSKVRRPASHDVSTVQEILSPTHGKLNSATLDLRVLQQSAGSHEQLLQTAQAPLPVCRCMFLEDQVKQASEMQEEQKDTGSHDIINLCPVSSEPSRPLPDHPFLQQRDACSLPSSPHPGWWRRRKFPCSLPCSPLLGGQPCSAPTTSLSPPPNLSRLWVEAALQRSKNTRHGKPRHPSSGTSQVRQGQEEERRSRWKNREEEWSDEEQEEDDKGNTVGIRLSDTVIFRPMTLTCVSGKGQSQEEEEEEVLCLDPDMWRYCLLTPCICLRCPSAPPYEEQEGGVGPSLPSEGAPGVPESSALYPSLSHLTIRWPTSSPM